MAAFVFGYIVYYFVFKKILNYIMFASREMYVFSGLFSILGVSRENVPMIWAAIYVLFSVMPLLLFLLAKKKKRSIVISAVLSFVFLFGGTAIGLYADSKIIYNKEVWGKYPYARCLMLYDMQERFVGQYSKEDIIEELGDYIDIIDYDENGYTVTLKFEDYYYVSKKIYIRFRKETKECVSVRW